MAHGVVLVVPLLLDAAVEVDFHGCLLYTSYRRC